MTTFVCGILGLVLGGLAYGYFCTKVMKPDDRKTPAYTKEDGVDYVPMPTWKTALINLLNIAGTGPVLGAIQGILFGPIAFILIPLGCVLGGAMHDYFSGMISMRNDGAQMPSIIKKYTGNASYQFYTVFVCILLVLVGAVFIYTPGDIAATQIFQFDGKPTSISTWVIYGVIFAYYLIATLFPIDKIIGKVYPVFGAILILSAVGLLAVILFTRGGDLTNIGGVTNFDLTPQTLIPAFFLTVACGIVSGFHSTQNALIGRSVKSEKSGRMVFYNMMIVEGIIAMIWAAAAMVMYNTGKAISVGADATSPVGVVGIISKDLLGNVGGYVAIVGVIILSITSGDTALRSLRLMIAERFKIDQIPKKNRLILSAGIFVVVAALLIFAKVNAGGFNLLWRYFAWANQSIAIFAFASIAIYLFGRRYKIAPIMAIVPGAFYSFLICTFISGAEIGFNLNRINGWLSYVVGGCFAVLYVVFIFVRGKKIDKEE
jgi:carbon starvation protein CstA